MREIERALPFSFRAESDAATWKSFPRYESAPASPLPARSAAWKRFPAFCPAAPLTSFLEPETFSESCQSSASLRRSSTTVTSISTSICGASSSRMSFSYIGMREATSRTSTALSLLSGRITGRNAALCVSSRRDISFVTAASCVLPSPLLDIISSSICATPLIIIVLSGDDTEKLTLSAHVWTSGKRRISTSLNVRFSRSLSAFSMSSAMMAT